MLARSQEDPTGELFGILTASAEWYCDGLVAGFCAFRRTWCNHLAFDFLGVHPALLSSGPRNISGLGTALLYRLAMLAVDLQAGMIWAETTDTSAPFYRRLFELPSLSDLLVIEPAKFLKPLTSFVEALNRQ